ncbi:hypothetical protein diail_12175 [Diaporthe ilicicola]|nr:hypothetical protein diail_12175 [Diaporthe ilicicola]
MGLPDHRELAKPVSQEDSKPYYVTTPIFYVNAAPHIGHMYTMILADVLKRWHQLKGRQSLLLTGTDEHGMKVQQAAENHDTPPKEWCDIQAEKFKQLAAKTNLANDFFIRTTDEDHKEAVRHFWYLLKEKGLIYESKHEGWYCVSDETFYPESMLERKVDALTGEVSLASIEGGNSVEWTEEKNYHFRMSALKDQLLEFYQQNPDFIVPRSRMREVVSWVQNNLEDLSISRPSSRLNWGIRVPGDDSQTIYVWVDALINYLTKAGFPKWTPGEETDGGWPADVHVIGKDIVRFHGVYWPALLLAVGLSPPKKLLSHAHWTMNGRKMSKSLGNVVNPYYAIDRWGVDTMRLFMVLDGGIDNDANYDNQSIVHRYKKVLAGTFGNLLSRTTRSKAWNVRTSVQAAPMLSTSIQVGERHALLFEQQKARITALYREMDESMRSLDPRRALMALIEVAFGANRFISEMAPWAMSRGILEKSPEERERLNALMAQTIFIMAEILRNVGILLQPYMPTKAEHILDVLGVPVEKRTFEYCGFGTDFDYGKPMRDPGKSAQETISNPGRVLFVPYDRHHVLRYHDWMSDPEIQEATASEPLTMEEEYENQQSWRESHDKLTFILCKPAAINGAPGSCVQAGEVDSPDKMIGDINFFLYPWDDEPEGNEAGTSSAHPSYCVGEIDIMIASENDRGKGLGKAAVSTFMHYIWSNRAAILREYQSAAQLKLRFLMAKIKATNTHSIALFKSLGFEQEGDVNYFGELKLVLHNLDRLATPPDGYRVVDFKRPVN